MRAGILLVIALLSDSIAPQTTPQPDWQKFDDETLRHFQQLVRFDTSDPPGVVAPAAD
jgi:hypothetical protein